VIPHRLTGQVPHTHDCIDDVRACEAEALDVFDRFARAFEDAA
jgi:hypothetical protein